LVTWLSITSTSLVRYPSFAPIRLLRSILQRVSLLAASRVKNKNIKKTGGSYEKSDGINVGGYVDVLISRLWK
jgi:hypothetical protein